MMCSCCFVALGTSGGGKTFTLTGHEIRAGPERPQLENGLSANESKAVGLLRPGLV